METCGYDLFSNFFLPLISFISLRFLLLLVRLSCRTKLYVNKTFGIDTCNRFHHVPSIVFVKATVLLFFTVFFYLKKIIFYLSKKILTLSFLISVTSVSRITNYKCVCKTQLIFSSFSHQTLLLCRRIFFDFLLRVNITHNNCKL